MSEFLELVAAERKRQIEEESWTLAHDREEHPNGELSMAAACYAATEDIFKLRKEYAPVWFPVWPWSPVRDKRHKHDRKRQLVIAAALLQAEWDRLTAEEREEAK